MRIENDPSLNLGKQPEDDLSAEEMEKAKKLVSMIDKSSSLKEGRPSEQISSWIDQPKNPYRGIKSSSKKSKTEIITDGKIVYGKAYPMASQDMIQYEVWDYNYVLIKQHFPAPDTTSKESKYQSLVVRRVPFKYYVQKLLGRPIG